MEKMIPFLFAVFFGFGNAVLAGCDDDDDNDAAGDADVDSDADADSDADCESCHADFPPKTGQHEAHALKCFNCHDKVVDRDNRIIDQQKHDDGEPDIFFHNGGTYDGDTRTCTDACHHMGTLNW